MADPRAENCRGFATNSAGLVSGVLLAVRPMAGTRYELVRAELIDEAAAGGNVVATCVVLDKNGIQTGEPVFLAWPWPSMADGKTPPGNPNNQHMMSGLPYNPPDVGPGALYVGDADGKPISDILGGLGLPYKRHVCYRATWRERGAPPPVDPTPEEIGGAVADLLLQANERLVEIRDLIRAGFRL